MQKKLIRVLVIPMIIFGIASCSSKGGGGGGGGGGTTEANLVVTLSPPAGSNEPPAPGTEFPLTVTVTSTMPPQGVTINVKAAPDGTTNYFFDETKSATAATTPFSITNTPTTVICLVTVTVTSKTKAANTWTGSYRYSRKP